MDDILKLNNSEKYLLALSKDLVKMLSNCSFRLTKWRSNSNIISLSLLQRVLEIFNEH